MNINQAGLELIKEFEGCRLTSYRDAGGIYTIGWGHTKGVKPGMQITKERAERLLEQDIYIFELAVNKAIAGTPTTQNQFSAMCSLAYNIGPGQFGKSTVIKQHRAGRYGLAAAAFLLWVKVGRRTLPGLLRRRRAERELYLTA